MKQALAPLTLALLAIGCAAAGEASAPEEQQVAEARADCQASAGATAPDRVEKVRRAVGEPAWVVDRADVLSEAAEQQLAERVQALESATTDQVIVVTVPGLGGEKIEAFSLTLANSWGAGSADLDNGVLLLLAPRERLVRIEVGCGLEEVLTDARAAEIIGRMTPHFSQGRFDEAVTIGVNEVVTTLRARPERQRAT